MGFTVDDLRRAILAGGDAAPFVPALQCALGYPPLPIISKLESPLELPEPAALLKNVDSGLASLLDEWQKGNGYDYTAPSGIELTMLGLAPYGRNVGQYLEAVFDRIKPDVVALDIAPIMLSASMLYAFSMPCAVGMPICGEILFKGLGRRYATETFYPGSVSQTLIIKCWLNKVPLVPVGIPFLSGEAVDELYLNKEIQESNLLAAYQAFDDKIPNADDPEDGMKIAEEVCSRLRKTMGNISEALIDEASYTASRIMDIASYFTHLGRKARLFAIVDIKHYLDTEYVMGLLKEGISEEVYLPPGGEIPAAALEMTGKRLPEPTEHHARTPGTTPLQERFRPELEKLAMAKGEEPIPESEADALIAAIAARTREHPDIVRPASVRGTIAFKEVLQGFGEIENGLTRSSIEKAALVTLPPRVSARQGNGGSAQAIVSDIVHEVLYGIQYRQAESGPLPDKSGWLYPDDIVSALQNLGAANKLQKNQGRTNKGRTVIVSDKDSEKLSQLLAGREGKGWHVATRQAIEQLMRGLEQKLRRGEISQDDYRREKTKLEEMLSAASQLRSGMSGKELAETMMEFLDAKDKQWAKELSFQDMYVYYHTKGTCEGKQLSPPKRGWYGLRVVIDYLEKRGVLETEVRGKSFMPTAEALNALVEQLIPRAAKGRELEGVIVSGKARATERKQEIRRYTLGDVFKDISVRHTLREIARQKKTLSQVARRDFKVFMKQQREPQSDIVLCIDTSGSMGFRQKLIQARLVAAGIARAALEKGDRVGVVTFDDLGRATMPLTDNSEEVFGYLARINAGGNTNIGDGIKCAAQLLRHAPDRNQKYIVLITDGQPSAISEKAFAQVKAAKEKDVTEEYAILETRRASSSGVRTSVIHINGGQEGGEEFVQTVAKVGKGQVGRVGSLADIRLLCGRERRRRSFSNS